MDTQNSQSTRDKQSEDTDRSEEVVVRKKSSRTESSGALPKDRNKRVREQAARKMEEAKTSAKNRAQRIGATGLDAGEMFDDIRGRTWESIVKFVKRHSTAIQITIVAVIVLGVGYAIFDWYTTKHREEASTALMLGVKNMAGVVEEKSDGAAGKPDGRLRFESYDAMRDQALQAYRSAAVENASSGTGILARLGEAGVLLDKRDYDGALAAANAVIETDLAKADESVRMAARERVAMALEGKGDLVGARAAYALLAGSSVAVYKNLGLYHQARMAVDAGDMDEANRKLEELWGRIAPKDVSDVGRSEFLMTQVQFLARKIGPSAQTTGMGSNQGGGRPTAEQYLHLQQQLEALSQGMTDSDDSPVVVVVGDGGVAEPSVAPGAAGASGGSGVPSAPTGSGALDGGR